ncbi:MAG: cyclic pyranopterin monophosphate synthase MoaC [Actinobacteria bacterium]|nr:cyclic pyranopterin monophosphate synthase MoaC [Actinomycetota bacterium]
MAQRLSHVDEHGRARMVDVGDKGQTRRTARAEASVRMARATLAMIVEEAAPKGDVLGTARLAGMMAAKKTAELIPLCHPLPLDAVDIDIEVDEELPGLHIVAAARVTARTGVEMEALTAAGVAALTVYDMCKAVDRGMQIDAVRLLEKRGGRSGHWRRGDEAAGAGGGEASEGPGDGAAGGSGADGGAADEGSDRAAVGDAR